MPDLSWIVATGEDELNHDAFTQQHPLVREPLGALCHDGKLAYCHNLLSLQRFKVYGETPVPPGAHQVRMEFAYDGGGLA